MNVHNNSSRIYSQPVLEAKIKKTKNHIEHLTGALAHRNTHGGKRYRTRQISLHDQIKSASEDLALLNQAKKVARAKPEPHADKTGIYDRISEELLDSTDFKLMDEAVALYPCAHTFNKNTLDDIKKLERFNCPACNVSIRGEGDDLIVRNIVKHYQTMQNPEKFEEGFHNIQKELEDPRTQKPMMDAVILAPCGHTLDKSTIEDITKLGKNNCYSCKTPIEHITPHHTVRNLSALMTSKPEQQITDPITFKNIVDTLTLEDFDLIGDHVGNIFASSIKIPTPRVPLDYYYYNSKYNRQESFHNYPPTAYHRGVSRILSVNLLNEIKAGTTSREYTHAHFLMKLKNLDAFRIVEKIAPYASSDFKIQIELDPKRNCHAQEKKDLIFSISMIKEGDKKTRSFALKDLKPIFPSDSLWR